MGQTASSQSFQFGDSWLYCSPSIFHPNVTCHLMNYLEKGIVVLSFKLGFRFDRIKIHNLYQISQESSH